MRKTLITVVIFFCFHSSFAQYGWTLTKTPDLENRVDDLFMLNPITGYAICGDGKIMKTVDGGSNWSLLLSDTTIYCRSVEFINEKKGFVGGLPRHYPPLPHYNIFRETLDGGATWIDLTSKLNVAATDGICGLDVADSNTIYGCGNYYDTTGYIIKSTDGGETWNFIDMSKYASNLIDMYFTSKDTGFVTGTSNDALSTAIILYTTDGGATWTYKFKNTTPSELCWKIQHLTNLTYFASIEDEAQKNKPTILKSIDGGMTWTKNIIADYASNTTGYTIQGVGFLNDSIGFAGGDGLLNYSFQTANGGVTWGQMKVCPGMDRVFRVNDTLLFATGNESIWKYSSQIAAQPPQMPIVTNGFFIEGYPNPANENLTITDSITKSTHVLIVLFDYNGRKMKIIENSNKSKGNYLYNLDTRGLSSGIYILSLQTHEFATTYKFIVAH